MGTSSAACVLQMIPTPTPYTSPINSTSAVIELRRRIAESTLASNLARAASVITPRSTNFRTVGPRR